MSLSGLIKLALYRDANLQWLDPTHAVIPLLAGLGGSIASVAYPTANRMFAYPFSVASPKTVSKIIVPVGAATSGNLDVGILGPTGTRLSSSGATAVGSTNTAQTVDITDVALTAGTLYYVAIACDNTTAAFAAYPNLAVDSLWQAEQVKITDTAYPIPASPTLATPTSGQRTPVLFMEFAA